MTLPERGQQVTRHGLEVRAFSSSFLTPGLTCTVICRKSAPVHQDAVKYPVFGRSDEVLLFAKHLELLVGTASINS